MGIPQVGMGLRAHPSVGAKESPVPSKMPHYLKDRKLSVWSSQRKPALYLFLSLWVIYLLTYSGLLHSVDEQSLLAIGETVLSGRGWHVNQMTWEQSWSPPQSAVGTDGNLYVYKRGFLLALLALPLFALGKAGSALGAVQSALLLGPLISALTGYFLFRALRRLDIAPKTAVICVLAWGVATPAFAYARMLFTEPMAALCMTIAFDSIVAWRTQRSHTGRWAYGRLILAGAALGLLFVNKLANVVVIPVFGLYLLYWLAIELRHGRSWRPLVGSALSFGLPILAGLALMVGYNVASFGVLLATPFSGEEGFTTPLWIGLSGLLFSPGKGLIWYAPLVWLLIPGLWIGLRRSRHRAERLLALGVFLALLGIYAAWFDWAGGRSWGPRFLVPALPLLVLLIAPTLDWWNDPHRPRRVMVVALLAFSVAAQLPGVLTNPSVEEARLLGSGVGLDQLYWHWPNSPLLFGWSAILDGRLEPLVTQSLFWHNPLALAGMAALVLACVGLSVGMRRPSGWGQGGALILATLGALALAAVLPLTANGDPRWHETSSDPAENVALWSFLAEAGDEHDVVLLDLIPYFDILGRTSIWMDRAPTPPAYVGWQRQTPLTAPDQAQLAHRLLPYARVWLSLQGTPPGASDSTTEQWLDRWAYRGEERWFGTQRLVLYAVPTPHDPAWLAGPVESGAVTLQQVAVRPGQARNVRLVDLRWGAAEAADLRFSLQVLDAQGQVTTQIDRLPAGVTGGDGALDRLGVTLPGDEATIILKLYDAATGQPIPWQVDGGQQDWLTLDPEGRSLAATRSDR